MIVFFSLKKKRKKKLPIILERVKLYYGPYIAMWIMNKYTILINILEVHYICTESILFDINVPNNIYCVVK